MVDRVRILLVIEAGLEQLLHFLNAAFVVREELHRQPLEDHIILRECARLVREQVLNAAQLFWDVGVARERVRNVLVLVDLISVVQLSEVEVDSHRDWYDVAEKQQAAEVLEIPATNELVKCNNNQGKQEHHYEQTLRQIVALLVKQAQLRPRHFRTHVGPSLLAGIHDQPIDVALRGEDSVLPHGVLKG